MKRAQVLFDEATYDSLRSEAHRRGRSISAVLREIVREHLRHEPPRRLSIEDFTFIGSGDSRQTPHDPFYPISEHHDEVLADDLYAEIQEKARELREYEEARER